MKLLEEMICYNSFPMMKSKKERNSNQTVMTKKQNREEIWTTDTDSMMMTMKLKEKNWFSTESCDWKKKTELTDSLSLSLENQSDIR